MISLVFAAALLAADTPAAAEAAQVAPAKAGKADKNGMVCRKEPVLGSRMKERVCLTQAEWDQRQQQDRDMVDQAQRNRALNGN